MDVITVAIQKGLEARKKKQVLNVQTEEVQAERGKSIRQSNQVPRRVIFKSSSRRTEHDEIVANELVTPASKSSKQSRKRNMVESASIPVEGIVDLEGTPSN